MKPKPNSSRTRMVAALAGAARTANITASRQKRRRAETFRVVMRNPGVCLVDAPKLPSAHHRVDAASPCAPGVAFALAPLTAHPCIARDMRHVTEVAYRDHALAREGNLDEVVRLLRTRRRKDGEHEATVQVRRHEKPVAPG